MTAIHLTELESQVLEVVQRIWATSPEYYEEEALYAFVIYGEGTGAYGDSWGGSICPTQTTFHTYPTIDAALGRLRRKGLLERRHDAAHHGGNRGKWFFTDLGKEFVGLA